MPGVQISIDRGGTFTDVHASVPGRDDIILKVLSVDPANYADAPTEGVRRILELVTGTPHPRGTPLDTAPIDRIRMGTTVGTNALLERKGARSALLVTKGFRDLLRISNQSRPRIFDLTVATPELLYQDVVEVDERITLEGYSEDPEPQVIDAASDPDLHVGLTGEVVRVLRTPDLDAVRKSLQKLWDDGYRSLSVVFLHSYVYPRHEQLVGSLAREMGFSAVESAALQPMIKAVPRGTSATADAYLTPIIRSYIDSISANFKGGLEAADLRCDFMQSDGGLVDFRAFSGLKSILSGPAGGVVGYAQTSWDADQRKPIIGFDMGGTSTDCSRFAGTYEHVFETTTAGVLIQSPQLDIITVAAGGGSMLFWRNGLFAVGPESAGAHPGPACYRKGGPLTITDANLFLGRIAPDYFPKIFGPNEDQPLGTEIVAEKFAQLTEEINADNRAGGRAAFTAEQVALGFLQVASEVMARPIRALTEARGYDTSDHILSCFGGAGGQHACDVATALSISQVVIHKYSSILSAYGLSLADLVHEVQRPAAIDFSPASFPAIEKTLADMSVDATEHLSGQKIEAGRIRLEVYLNMRYEGSNSAFMIMQHAGEETANFGKSFEAKHSREFGFVFPEKKILIDDFRVRAVGSTSEHKEKSPYRQLLDIADKKVDAPAAEGKTRVCFDAAEGGVDTNLFLLGKLEAGVKIPGPALILDQTQTILVKPKAIAIILDSTVVIELEGSPSASGQSQDVQKTVNPIQLSIFGHRFMSIAEQMGRTLQKTAVSTNIKERLDFSCAIFSPDGGLVANAPHVPVHLGSMQFCVRHLHNQWKGRLEEGDVLLSNHPSSGGTHLPDITVVTPVFDHGEIVFFVASRGHHADIGGSRPGSMPPDSHFLYEEGAAILGEKLVSNGRFNEERIIEILLHEPAQYPGISGTRTLSDNLSDLKAQVAANKQGINLIQALIQEYTLPEVHKYMFAIQDNAEQAVRALLKKMHASMPSTGLRATDYMDDGTPISLAITIDPATGSAIFDFAGTGPQVYGNTNAPRAITHSAIIYCLRALVASDIPLNQGCLAPIDVRIPPNTILSPAAGASVVGGNVLTSQRITDVVLSAFGACADSSGCMNNLTFGMGGKRIDAASGKEVIDKGFGYYETIGGGAGAGPTWDGTSGVHTHMTNTRITDPEVLEKRYPVLLRAFGVRAGSGGDGARRGGDGIVRDIEFLVPGVQVSILSERRSRAPRGAAGGGNGGMGRNTWVRKSDGLAISLGGKATASFAKGDRIIIETPGGGGYGARS
ncbi:hypothetical protein ACHAQA_006312 [Verticillium albo-atrum]